jgi:hypothetical protein
LKIVDLAVDESGDGCCFTSENSEGWLLWRWIVNTSRRHHLNQVFPTVVLLYVTFTSGYEGPTTGVFHSQFKKIFSEDSVDLGRGIVTLFRLLLAGVAFEADSFTSEVSSLIEACTRMDWLAMLDAKVALFDFLVQDPLCKGQLQYLWKNRVT